MTTYYTYKLVHRITGQFYIGCRKTKRQSAYSDLGHSYHSSGKMVKILGFDNFYFGVIDDCFPDHDSCYWTEQLMIKNSWHDPLILNRHHVDPHTKERKWSREGIKITDPLTLHRMRTMNIGRKRSQETKDRVASSKIGKRRPAFSQAWLDNLSLASKGKPKSPQTRQKMSQYQKGRKRSEQHKESIRLSWISRRERNL